MRASSPAESPIGFSAAQSSGRRPAQRRRVVAARRFRSAVPALARKPRGGPVHLRDADAALQGDVAEEQVEHLGELVPHGLDRVGDDRACANGRPGRSTCSTRPTIRSRKSAWTQESGNSTVCSKAMPASLVRRVLPRAAGQIVGDAEPRFGHAPRRRSDPGCRLGLEAQTDLRQQLLQVSSGGGHGASGSGRRGSSPSPRRRRRDGAPRFPPNSGASSFSRLPRRSASAVQASRSRAGSSPGPRPVRRRR